LKPLFFPLLLGAIFLFSCSEPSTKEQFVEKEIPLAEFDTTKINTQADSLPLILNQENHEAYLREYFEDNPERKFKLTTRLGDIKVRLFDDTPLHTANFVMLIKRGYFDNTEFTRVAKNFVVQGGNNDSEQEEIKRLLIGNYLIEPEFNEEHIHKKGALAMARRYTENPEKKSSAYNFYFVQGQVFNEPQLLAIERDNEITIEPWKRDIYKTIGGAPHLDNEHTVFGEVYEGLDVLEKMSLVETDQSEWPLEPLIMKIEIIE
jgi:peptidyl-prolyl cis-trans isomerase B (cyclophilin B)